MIHPIVLMSVVLVTLSSCFALIYLSFHLYTRSEDRRLELERDRYRTAVEVAARETYSIRCQQNEEGQSHSVFLTIIGPKSHSIEPDTMGSPVNVQIETDADIMDEIAATWIHYRGVAGVAGGPVGDELGSSENPWI